MPTSRRTRLSVLAAALSGALVVAMAGTALAADDLNCSDFDFQEEAQAVLDADRSDPNRLDGGSDGPADGVACESLPSRGASSDAEDSDDEDGAPVTTPAAEPDADGDEDEDRDCTDFATQAAAQAALTARAGDPEQLDSDDDGIACEQHFGTEGQQVAVHPRGGVATGGAAHP
ncbi:excalibur calcium-binding domain-containing protein [Pseudonocardia sp. DLS-67]